MRLGDFDPSISFDQELLQFGNLLYKRVNLWATNCYPRMAFSQMGIGQIRTKFGYIVRLYKKWSKSHSTFLLDMKELEYLYNYQLLLHNNTYPLRPTVLQFLLARQKFIEEGTIRFNHDLVDCMEFFVPQNYKSSLGYYEHTVLSDVILDRSDYV